MPRLAGIQCPAHLVHHCGRCDARRFVHHHQILVLEEGEVVERGTHDELMLADGRYRELHDRQYAWETNRFVNPGEDY